MACERCDGTGRQSVMDPDLPAMLRVTGGYRYPGRVGVQMPIRLAKVS